MWLPPGDFESHGASAVEIARLVELDLDPWQEFVLEAGLRFKANRRWVATTVGLVVPRQNGKSALLAARELVGAFVIGERLIVHTAHKFDTAIEAFRDLADRVTDCPDLKVELKPKTGIRTANGTEGIELRSGQRIRYRARTGTGGRGPSVDCLIFDEAMDLSPEAHRSMLFSSSARPNQQAWYAGSSVDQTTQQDGRVLAGIRHGSLTSEPKATAYMEWSADGDLDNLKGVLDDREAWAQANPALGDRIRWETVEGEREKLRADPRAFAVERLGIGDWPTPGDVVAGVEIPAEVWRALFDASPAVNGRGFLALDVQPNFRSACIGACKARVGGGHHIDVVAHRSGTGWVVDEVKAVVDRHGLPGVAVAERSPAAALIEPLENAGITVFRVSQADYARTCGVVLLEIEQGILRHGEPDGPVRVLTEAVAGARSRAAGDARYWSRSSSAVDITPLVACTLALWGLDNFAGPSVYQGRGVLTIG